MKKKISAIGELKNNGITIIKKVINAKECSKLKKYFISLSKKRLKEGEKIFIDDGSIRISNFFLENYKLTKYLFNLKLHELLNSLLGDPYVLRVGNAMNLQDKEDKRVKNGTGWHTDWGYNSENIKFGYGGSYHTILALDDFKSNNGATHYIKGSHKWKSKPKRDKKYKSSKIIMKKGSMAIFDSAIWHKSGVPSKFSRWGIWNVYTQWWVKPYFRYQDMFNKKIKNKLDKNICKILHLNSTPPLNGKKRVLTVEKLS
jgi:ectoine hydroxylase-related dioxygenase (phytanoyl-CoA dioxygenase family)